MSSDPKPRVTLEDLLQLKRREQPRAEFWAQFDTELRQKQLAAIVAQRPWWVRFARLLHGVSRFYAPLGAAAALIAAAAGYREYRLIAARSSPSGDIPAAAIAAPDAASGVLLADAEAEGADRVHSAEALVRHPRAAEVAYRDAAMAGPSSLRPWGVVSRRQVWRDGEDSPSARSIEANLAVARASEPEILRNLLSLSQRFDSQLVPERRRPAAEPLAQITSISLERRDRLMAESLPAAAAGPVRTAPPSDRLVRTLSDDRFYEEAVSRYRVGGDGDHPSLSIKF